MTAKNARLNKIAIPLLLIGLLISLVVAVPVFGDEQAEHPFQYGDVNNDGKINVTDAIMVLRHIVGLINLGDEDEDHYEFAQYAAAVTDEYDSDEGKLINVSDAIQILRAIVDLIDPSEFPAQKRLDEAEGQLLDAINDGDLDAANGAIEFLPPIPPVIEMGKSIEVLEEILAAESLDDIDAIEESIDELPDGDTKDALQARLDALKALIEATDAIDALPDLTDEGIAAVEDAAAGIAAARGLVEAALALGADEADIDNLADLVTAEAFVAALDAAKAAEDSRDADDIADAQGLIDGLPDGDTKDALQARLDDLVKAMAIDAAIEAIDALPDLTDEGIDAIEDAAADIAAARGLVVAALALGAEEADIDNLADLVTAEAFVAALEAVKAAEDSRNAADVGVAQGLIDGLPGGDTKDALQARLDALKALIEAIDAAIDAIDALPDLTDEGIDAIEDAAADIAAARGLVEAALPLGAEEGDIVNLADLVTAEGFVAALDAVKAAEDSRNAADVGVAQGLIDELPDGDTKDALQDRLDDVDVFTEGLLVHSVGFSDKTGVLYKRGNDLYYNSIGSDGKWGSEALISEGGTQGRLAIDSDGNPHVVYVTKATNGKDAIGYRMYDGSDWTEEEQIVSNDFGKTGECSKPDIAVDSEGNAHITYTDTMGSDKDPYEEDDIMYATNSGGTFENTLVYRGYKSYVENYGSETGQDAHYYKKGSFITVDSQNNYCILSFYNYWNRYGRDRYNTYAIVATTATTSEGGGGSFSVSANSDIYDLAYDDEENRIVALFMDNDVVKIAEIVESGGNVSFDNIEDLTGASEVHSIAAADGNIVVGGVDGGNLQIYCNGVEVSFDEDIPVFSNSRVTVVYTGGDFYAVYTDSENTIQRQLIEL